MSPSSRRALLTTLTAGMAGTVAGCSAWIDEPSTASDFPPTLKNRTLHVADGVSVPRVNGLNRTADPTSADVAVFPADAGVASIVSALQTETVTAIVGSDAQAKLMEVCASDGRSYGFARDSWSSEPSVVAANPRDACIDTHFFVGVDLPADLPWALAETFTTADPACQLRGDTSAPPAQVADRARTVGASRIRGLNDVGGFDRWDRVRATTHSNGVDYVVDMTGVIFAGSAARHSSDYNSDQIRLVAHTDEQVEYASLGIGGLPVDTLKIDNRTDRSEGVVELAVSSQSDAARRTFNACQRAVITTETAENQFDYIANGRFRWRKPALFDDDHWHHHTPGQAVWYPSGN